MLDCYLAVSCDSSNEEINHNFPGSFQSLFGLRKQNVMLINDL